MGRRGSSVIAATCALWCARAAVAAPAGDPPPATLAVQVLPAGGLTEAERHLITRAAAMAATEAGRWKVVAPLPGGPAAVRMRSDKALDRSDKSLAEARKRIKNLEDGALDLLDWAADEYAHYLPDLVARDGSPRRLIEVHAQQTIAHYLEGQQEQATAALRHCFVLDPELDYDRKVFPPQLEKFVMQERLLFDELGTGKLSIAGATGVTAWVNGVHRGVTPLELDGLRAGPNFVTLAVPGLDPVTTTVAIDGGHESQVDAAAMLAPSKASGALARVGGEAGKSSAGPQLRKLAAELDAGALVIIAAVRRGGALALTSTVYDMRSGARVGGGEAATDKAGAEAAAAELTRGVLVIGGVWVVASSGMSNAERVTLFSVVSF